MIGEKFKNKSEPIWQCHVVIGNTIMNDWEQIEESKKNSPILLS
jgi:hypothetical protein